MLMLVAFIAMISAILVPVVAGVRGCRAVDAAWKGNWPPSSCVNDRCGTGLTVRCFGVSCAISNGLGLGTAIASEHM